jgi:hypothetical protein
VIAAVAAGVGKKKIDAKARRIRATGVLGLYVALLVGMLVVAMIGVAVYEESDDDPPAKARARGDLSAVLAAVGQLTIRGPAALSAEDIQGWWSSTGRGQPADLGAPIDQVIAWYLSEGDAEGVMGDMAFAQAVLETGYFANGDTAINNFAGIAHYDNADSGSAFGNVQTGVRAQIQLLRKFVDGNDAVLANPDVSPSAGAHASTWAELAGTWATSTTYWTSLVAVYSSMATAFGPVAGDTAVGVEPAGPAGTLVAVPLCDASDCELDASWAPKLLGVLNLCRAQGFDIYIISANRTYAEQSVLYARYLAGGGLAARPGTSNHEGGQAVDLSWTGGGGIGPGDGAWECMKDNGPRFGVYQDPSITSRDSVHFSATGN